MPARANYPPVSDRTRSRTAGRVSQRTEGSGSGPEFDRRGVEARDLRELVDALGDLVGGQARDALGPELLDVERRQRRAVGHGAAQGVVVAGAAARGEVADEAAGEGVAGAGRVDDGLER